jgi:hypothetical protein
MARKRRDILAQRDSISFAAGILFVVQSLIFRRFSLDDAFIAYRYARHIGAGLGPVMNPGERVEGVSNLPWTALLGLPAALGLEPHTYAPLLSFFCGLVTVGLVAELASRVVGDGRAGGAASLFFASMAPVAVWSVSGMETLAYTCLLTLLGLVAVRALEKERNGVATGLLLGCVAVMRPEGACFAAPLLLASPHAYRWHARLLLGAACVVVPVLLFRFLFYGAWFPNPVYAKATLGAAVLGAGALYVAKMSLAYPLHFGAALLLPRAGVAAPAKRLLLGWIGVQVSLTLLVGGERVPGYRFLVPALPALAVAVEVALRRFRGDPMRSARLIVLPALAMLLGILILVAPRVLLPLANALLNLARTYRDATEHAPRLLGELRFVGAMSLATGIALALLRRGSAALRDVEEVDASKSARRKAPPFARPVHESTRARRAMGIALLVTLAVTLFPGWSDPSLRICLRPDPAVVHGRPVGEWLHEQVPESTLVATNCAGSLPYFSQVRVVDMLGLTDAHVARSRPDRSQWLGHEKGDGAYVLRRAPDVIVLGGPEGSATPWPFPADRQIAAAAEFQRDYVLRRVPLDGFDFLFYGRIDSVVPAISDSAATGTP